MSEPVQVQRAKVLDSLFQGYEGEPFSIRLWDGWRWDSNAARKPAFTIIFYSADALRSLVVRPSELTLGEAFLAKDIDIEGDIFSAFSMAEHVFQTARSQRQRISEAVLGLVAELGDWLKTEKRHSLSEDRAAISYHYDQPADFYRPWLGSSLAYSCAYFESGHDTIDAAQRNKMELICRKLRLQPRERFLDIGCGWGSLILHAACRHGVHAQGITISREQASVAESRIAQERAAQHCKVDLVDYRHAVERMETFDKIASVGMFEHVGLRNLPLYFRTAHRLLKPGGVFLNHGIARSHVATDRNLSFLDTAIVPFLRNVMVMQGPRRASFIDKYVFPDGELVTISQAMWAAESAGFEVRDVENLREHYELTLRRWVEGLQANASTLLTLVSEATYRIWLLYMAGSAAAFRRGDIAVYQMLLSRPDRGNSRLPLIRNDLYSCALADEEVEA